jgi:hypothetical protein
MPTRILAFTPTQTLTLSPSFFRAPTLTPTLALAQVYAPVLAWAPLLKRRHRYLVRRLFTPPLTVCHGDVHLDNIFFSPDFPGGLKMIDFGNMFFGQVTRGLSLSLNPKPIAKPYPQPEPNPKPQPKPEAHLTLSPTLTGATSHRQPPP